MKYPKEANEHGPTAAFFCPQAAAPDQAYLNGLHAFLSHDEHGKLLLADIMALKTEGIWDLFARTRQDLESLHPGAEFVDMLHDWAAGGPSDALAAARSGIVALPLLVILQVGQYLRYLQYHEISHQDLIDSVCHSGGLQGYCGGLPVCTSTHDRFTYTRGPTYREQS